MFCDLAEQLGLCEMKTFDLTVCHRWKSGGAPRLLFTSLA